VDVSTFFYNVRFTTGSLDDTSGRAVNNLFTNKQIATQANLELLQYANITKGIQDVYSFPLQTSTPFVRAPELALRSEAYQFCYVIFNGIAMPMDMRNMREAQNTYRYRPIQGITNWVVPWGAGKDQFFSVFPTNATAPRSATLATDILPDDTTITFSGDTGLIIQEGRITIGEEKILYTAKSGSTLTGCVRGIERTSPAKHTAGDAITQNNVIMFYARRAEPIEINDEDWMTKEQQLREIEVCEEHTQGILKATCYNLLTKVDTTRADRLKEDYLNLYNQYAIDIRKGYSRFHARGIRPEYTIAETGVPYGSNILY